MNLNVPRDENSMQGERTAVYLRRKRWMKVIDPRCGTAQILGCSGCIGRY